MKIRCVPRRRKRHYQIVLRDQASCTVQWSKAAPFLLNPRGILVHRVRDVVTHFNGYGQSWHHVDYLCENGCNLDKNKAADAFLHDVPEERLLCERCEHVANSSGLPSADELAGHHVHVGTLRAHRTCCKERES